MERLVGKKSPYFSMQALSPDGDQFIRVTLPDYDGKWLIMFFYPRDFTFVCPTELTAFSEMKDKFAEEGAELLSVSADSVYAHLAWQRDGLGKLRYPMASDPTRQACADYGVLIEEEGIALRGLFIIDPEQKIRYSVIHDNNVGRSPEEVLRVLAALKTGGLCAVNWSIGDENLKPAVKIKPELSGKPSAAAVKLYVMPGCSYCRSIKELLTRAGVSYETVDLSVDRDGQRFMQEKGYTRLPVSVVDGTELEGYNPAKLKEMLGIS